MTKEREISLRDLFWYVLSHWKLLIVFMLLGAIALSGFKYIRGMEGRSESTVELSDVDAASLNVYFGYKKMYDTQLQYNNTAEIMRLDPQNTYCAYYNYFLEADDQDMLQPIMRAYEIGLRALQEEYGEIQGYGTGAFLNAANAYGANETAEETDAMLGQIYGWVLGESEDICRERTKEIETFIEEKQTEINKTVAPHRLYGLQENFRKEPSDAIATKQKTYIDNLNNYTNGLNTAYKNLSEDAKEFLKGTSAETFAEELQEQLAIKEQALAEDSSEEQKEIRTKTSLGISKKILALGLLGGLILGILLLAVRYALSFKVKGEEDIEYITKIPLLAFIRDDSKRKKFFIDAAIEKRRFKNLRYQTESEGLQAAAVKIRKLAEASNASEVYVSGSFMGSREAEIAEKIKELLNGSGINLITGDVSIRCGNALEEATKTGVVILAEKERKSDYETIANTARDFKNMGVKVLGMYAVE